MDPRPQQLCLLLTVLVIKILLIDPHQLQVSASIATSITSSSSSSSSTSATATDQARAFFQPALIGFRCEGVTEQTPDGVAIIESNLPVRITLFGEAFTTNTIVAFTTELVQHEADIVLDESASNPELALQTSSSQASGRSTQSETINQPPPPPPKTTTTKSPEDILPLGNRLRFDRSVRDFPFDSAQEESANNKPSQGSLASNDKQSLVVSGGGKARSVGLDAGSRRSRRRLLGKQYDCTDYDRVISYKLSHENIITPNVAVLTIRLPELDWSSPGKYYYFCLKQPPIPSLAGQESLLTADAAAAAAATKLAASVSLNNQSVWNTLVAYNDSTRGQQNDTYNNHRLIAASPPSSDHSKNDASLVWVHQGDEWWLTIKAEPPILSVANDCVLIVLLLFLSAVTSGLNLGLMSLDMNELAVIGSCGDPRERSYARTIAPLRKRGNYLLCSLLLGNVMVNSTLTVILEEMTSGLVAVIGSTLAIVVLGEIVPQAFCARQGLAIGAKTIYLTYAFMIITFPLSYPISCLLDCILGEEKGNVYDRERLMEFIRITGNHTQLEADEVAIISGALKLKKIKVDQIMTRIEDVFMLPIDCMLNRETIKRIIEKGYSRIPIYEYGDRKQIVALILAKDLALLDPDDQVPLADMLMYCKHPLIFIDDTAALDVALNEFKTGKSHMAIVRQIYDDGEVDKYYEAIGVVTLEDVIEEVLQTEINDETDTLSDNRRKRRRTDAQVAHLVENLAQQHPSLAGSTTSGASAKF